jgi:hypothetical protein
MPATQTKKHNAANRTAFSSVNLSLPSSYRDFESVAIIPMPVFRLLVQACTHGTSHFSIRVHQWSIA